MYNIFSYYYTSLIFFALYLAARRCGNVYAVLISQECYVAGIHFEAFVTNRPAKYLFHPDNNYRNEYNFITIKKNLVLNCLALRAVIAYSV